MRGRCENDARVMLHCKLFVQNSFCLVQILQADKPLPAPYRPSTEVPIFIRRNCPNIQPLPIVDGHIQEAPVNQLDCARVAAKAPLKASVPLAAPMVKKSVNDAVRARGGKFWK